MNRISSQNLIDEWKGANAVLLEYNISHGRLHIALTSDLKDECLSFQCIDAEYIRSKTRWTNCSFKIEEVNYKTEFNIPIHYVIKDESSDFEVHCGELMISEVPDFNELTTSTPR